MKYKANTVEEYYAQIPEDRKEAVQQLRKVCKDNLLEGFEEGMSYGFPSFVVPHSIYPAGYHCKPEEPLPFVSIASQAKHVGFYHMGIYANEDILKWYEEEYSNHAKYKLDMGKSCIRFKRMDDIPFDLIAELMQKITVEDWIKTYETAIKR